MEENYILTKNEQSVCRQTLKCYCRSEKDVPFKDLHAHLQQITGPNKLKNLALSRVFWDKYPYDEKLLEESHAQAIEIIQGIEKSIYANEEKSFFILNEAILLGVSIQCLEKALELGMFDIK